MVTKNFKNELWRQLHNARAARDVMHKIPTKRHSRIVWLLEIVTDPYIMKRLKKSGEEINANILPSIFRPSPSRKELRGLQRRLLTLSKDLKRVFGEGGDLFKRDLFLKLAEHCHSRATELRYVIMAGQINAVAKTPPKMTYKAFWRHLPIAMLCRELNAPQSVSFADVEKLLHCAYLARGVNRGRPPRSVEREYKHLLLFRSSNPLYSAAWPQVIQNVLDTSLRLVLPTTK